MLVSNNAKFEFVWNIFNTIFVCYNTFNFGSFWIRFLRYLSVKVKILQFIRKCSEKKLLKTIAFPTSLSQMLTMKYERKPKNEPKTN